MSALPLLRLKAKKASLSGRNILQGNLNLRLSLKAQRPMVADAPNPQHGRTTQPGCSRSTQRRFTP